MCSYVCRVELVAELRAIECLKTQDGLILYRALRGKVSAGRFGEFVFRALFCDCTIGRNTDVWPL